jgi:hypothetical protein
MNMHKPAEKGTALCSGLVSVLPVGSRRAGPLACVVSRAVKMRASEGHPRGCEEGGPAAVIDQLHHSTSNPHGAFLTTYIKLTADLHST